jgi:hypothetical protein
LKHYEIKNEINVVKILQEIEDYELEKNLNIYDYLLIGKVHISNILRWKNTRLL